MLMADEHISWEAGRLGGEEAGRSSKFKAQSRKAGRLGSQKKLKARRSSKLKAEG